ncbi:MAG: hypothetical protein P8P74_13350 [Crocinitomicaceae bacterium]|nr:hypothetical protein [Crocinitomicaceae bacterium]
MNTKSIIAGIFAVCLIAGSAIGQEQTEESSPKAPKEVKSLKKEIRKEVRMEDNDGVKTLTIITDDNGVISEEVFTGEAADAKLAELMPQMEDVSIEHEKVEERIEVQVDDDGNLKSVTVKQSRNGEETIKVLEGEEAQKKLDEVNAQTRKNIEGDKKVDEKVEKKRKKAKRASSNELEEK